jgi:hypothetical protein
MAKFMHQEVMKVTRVIMGGVKYVALSCDDFFTIDNQFWLFIHYCVVHNWVRIPIFISLNILLEDLGNDNLTKVIMEALTIGRGLLESSFVLGHMVLTLFKAQKMVLQNIFMTPMPFILLGCIACPIRLIWLSKHC